MGGTKSTTAEGDSGLSTLARGLKNDEDKDRRSCPHDGCHGTLELTDSDRVVCNGCRCTPDGVYLPLPPSKHYVTYVSSRRDPKGLWGESTDPDGWTRTVHVDHDEYDVSQNIRLAGGYEIVYDADDQRRPDGVSEEYTFNLHDDLELGESSWSGENP